MTELDELEIGIGKLKRTSEEQRRYIEELKRERSLLVKKNNEIADSIKKIQEQVRPAKSDVSELKKELEALTVLIQEMKKKESKFESILTEQKSNLFFLRSGFEKNLDRLLEEIEGRIRENRRIELARFNELKSRVERLSGVEEQLKDQDRDQKTVVETLVKDVSKLQQTVAGLTSLKFDAELKNISRGIASETKSLLKQITGNSETILSLRDRLQYLEPVVNRLSENLESQTKILNRMMDSKESFAKRTEALTSELKSLREKIASERERIAKLEEEKESHRREIEDVKKQLESGFQQTLQGRFREMEANLVSKSKSLEEELKSLSKEISLKRDRISVLEQDLRSQSKVQESRNKELAHSIESIQTSEAKRDESFKNTVERLQELRIRTEESLKSLNEKTAQISRIEGNLEKKIHRENEAVFKRLGSNYNELDERVLGSENTISGLIESVKGLGKRMEEQFIILNETGRSISLLEQRAGEQSKSQESHEKDIVRLREILGALEERVSGSEKLTSMMDDSLKDFEARSQQVLQDRTKELDAELAARTGDLSKELKSISKEMSSGAGRVSVLEKDMAGVKKQIESGFRQSVPGRIKELESTLALNSEKLSKELSSLSKEMSSERERITRLEEEMKNQSKELHTSIANESKSVDDYLKAITKDLVSEKERISLLGQELKNQSIEQKSRIKDTDSLRDGIEELKERISGSERTVSHISEAVTGMRTRIMDEESIAKKFEEQSKVIDKVTNAGERLTRLEEKLKNQTRDQDLRFSEVIAVIKDLELGEAKRIDEFNSFVDRFQKLRMKTEQNLGLFSQNVKRISDIKGEIKSEVSKENAGRMRELGLEFDGVKKRLNVTEGLLTQLNDTLEELRLGISGTGDRTRSVENELKILSERLSSEKDSRTSLEQRIKSQESNREALFANISNLIKEMEAGESKRVKEYNNFVEKFRDMRARANEAIRSIRKESNTLKKMNDDFSSRGSAISDSISTFKDEVSSRIKVNEEMYDSEMDEFKNKIDYIAKQLVECKSLQQEFNNILRGTGMAGEKAGPGKEPAQPVSEKPEILAGAIKKPKEDSIPGY
jgi:chromosome segregation ATPase